MSTAGEARLPPLVALSSRVTVKEALDAVTEQLPGSLAQMLDCSACAMRAAVTPGGSCKLKLLVCTTVTCTVLSAGAGAEARSAVASVRASSVAATAVDTLTTELTLYEAGA